MESILKITKCSKIELMKRLDFKGLQFYLFLPTFNILFRKKISKRISDYEGQVSLVLKDTTQYIIVSDNVVEYYIERNNLCQLREYFNLPEIIKDSPNPSPINKPTKKMLPRAKGQKEADSKELYKEFIKNQNIKQRSEK